MPLIATLTSLRFFAAAAIVLYHLNAAQFLQNMPPSLANGVSFFFVLSGFILYYNYRNMRRQDVGGFLVNRIARLWPVHAVTFVICLAFLPGAEKFLTSPQHQVAALFNLVLLHSYIPIKEMVFSVNAVSWSISAELFFYCVLPIIILSGRIWLALALSALAVVVQLSFIEVYGHTALIGATPTEPWAINWFIAIWQNPLVRVFEFVIGVAAGHLFVRHQASDMSRMAATVFEAASIAAVIFVIANQGFVMRHLNLAGLEFWSAWLAQSGGGISFAILIYIFAHQAGYISRLLMTPGMIFLGEISFAMYMVHQIIIALAGLHGLKSALGSSAALTIIAVIILLASWALYSLVERPGRRAIIAAFSRRLAPPRGTGLEQHASGS